jgi:hypothetical protein
MARALANCRHIFSRAVLFRLSTFHHGPCTGFRDLSSIASFTLMHISLAILYCLLDFDYSPTASPDYVQTAPNHLHTPCP